MNRNQKGIFQITLQPQPKSKPLRNAQNLDQNDDIKKENDDPEEK